MIDLEQLVTDELERLYPRLPVTENWADVLGRTGSSPETDLGSAPLRSRRDAPRTRAVRATGIAVGCAVAVAGAVAIVLVAHRQGMSFTDRALAALGQQPVLFAAVRTDNPAAAGGVNGVMRLSTGRIRPHSAVTEYWYQAKPRRLEIRYLRDGEIVGETYNTPAQGLTSSGFRSKPGGYALALSPALAGFLNGYRAALANHKARVVGQGTIGGRKVTWLSIPLPTGHDRDRVAVDAATYRPLRFRVIDPQGHYPSPWEIVTSIKTVSVQAAAFGLSRIVAQPSIGNVVENTTISREQAASALGGAALWPGVKAGSLPLLTLNKQRLHTGYPRKEHRAPVYGSGLELLYGSQTANGHLDWTKPYVRIAESAEPQMAYMFGTSLAGPVTFGFNPVPPDGWFDISANGTHGLAQFHQHGLYVTIEASSRALLTETIRRLHRIT